MPTNKWRLENKDYIALKAKEYRKNNKEKIQAQTKRWRESNKERTKAWKIKWESENKARRTQMTAKRRAIKRGASADGITPETRLVYSFCERLNKEHRHYLKKGPFSVDHIVPLVLGGAHQASNLQVVTSFYNSSKGAKMNFPRGIEIKIE